MFTVLICDEHIINDCYEKYYIYLKPFLNSRDFAFCKWYPNKPTLDEALPDLKEIILTKRDWRAIIVNDDSTWSIDAINKKNPFDYVDSDSVKIKVKDYESACKLREEKNALREKALQNPLAKLSIWLCGSPLLKKPNACVDDFSPFESGEESYKKALSEIDESFEAVEFDYNRVKNFEAISNNFGLFGELGNPPKVVIALSERVNGAAKANELQTYGDKLEFEYSDFYYDNLYPSKLRYLLYDIPFIKGTKNATEYFSFLSTLMVLASNDVPGGTLRDGRVYAIESVVDEGHIRDLCKRYNAKLQATVSQIDALEHRLTEHIKEPIDRNTAESAFQNSVTIPVEIDNFFDEESFLADYKDIGITRDNPEDELSSWQSQYENISKLFTKYLREPIRAVNVAVKDRFHANSTNNDERAIRLSEYQKEDIENFKREEEFNMESTPTAHIYNTAEYKERIKKSAEKVSKSILGRFTKERLKKAFAISIVAMFIGLLPLLITDLNTVKSFIVSLLIIIVTLLLFAIVGVVYVLVLKEQHKQAYQEFNNNMNSMVDEINGSLEGFSDYLSHACNVRRCFSVLDFAKQSFNRKLNILHNHKRIINNKIIEVNNLFASYLGDDDGQPASIVRPFDYDYTVLGDYQYEMPYNEAQTRITFMQDGNEIVIPIDYLKEIQVRREELYE